MNIHCLTNENNGIFKVLHLHHEQHRWYDEAWVGGVAENCPHEGRQVQVDGFHDHVKHLWFPAARSHKRVHWAQSRF